jgi:inner membrane protein
VDNFTHSLVGALLGRTGLKRLTGLATPTLILAANAPDIDVFAPLITGEPGLMAHRGFTHGIGGMVLLPPLLAAIMLAWNRWRPAGEAVRPLALLLLACIGVWTHPFLDYLTSYGTRLLEPFSDRWFYGDTLFIVDVWIWVALIAGFELSRWREMAGRSDWHVPAITAFGVILAYIGVNAAITVQARTVSAQRISRSVGPVMIAASPPPIEFWKRRVLWRGQGLSGSGSYDPLAEWNRVTLDPQIRPTRLDDPRLIATLRKSEQARAFLFWSRMPVVVEEGGRLFLGDQRFLGRRFRGGFLIPLDSAAEGP